MRRIRRTPTTRKGLRKFDHLPAEEAVVVAWTSLGSNPEWGAAAKVETRAAMPLLARALDRLVAESRGSSR